MNTINGSQHGETPLAASVEFDMVNMYVHLTDERMVTVLIATYKRLWDATPDQRLRLRIFGRGLGLRWDEIDEDLSVPGLVRDFGAEECRASERPQQAIR